MTDEAIKPAAAPPDRFPMLLREYAHNVNLDPMLEAALGVFVDAGERLQTEWDALLAEYRALPIR